MTTTRFTKEQLIKRLEEQESSARYALGFVQDSQILRDIEMDLRINEIAQASLEAEVSGRNPVLAYADSYRDMAKQGVESIPVWSVITDLERNIAMLYSAPPAPVLPGDYFSSLVDAARIRADKAMCKYPQPNYVLNKVAEESGEVIKEVIHYTEGRGDWNKVEYELIDNLAMLIRLVTEGDQVIGFTPPDVCRAALLQGSQPVSNRDELPVSEIECDICGFKSTDPDGAHYCCEDNSND